MRYKYYIHHPKDGTHVVVCISHYAGKPVKGTAKCASDDKFDEEFGMKLARLRCDAKVAEKRQARACAKYELAQDIAFQAKVFLEDAQSYAWDATEEYQAAKAALAEFEKDIY